MVRWRSDWPSRQRHGVNIAKHRGGQRAISTVHGISSYKNKLDRWAFFDVQRDVYWPWGLGDPYQCLKLAASLLRPSEVQQ
ncbi:hypothetical protein MRX96_004508 [Rhipicephalus microplus]